MSIDIQETFNDVIKDVLSNKVNEETFWVYVDAEKYLIKVTCEGSLPNFYCESLQFKRLTDTRFLIQHKTKVFTLRSPCWTFTEQTSRISSIATSEKSITVGTQKGSLDLYPFDSSIKKALGTHYSDVSSITYFPSAKVLLSGSTDMTIRLWDCDSGYNTRTFIGHKGEVTALETIGQFGRNFVSGSKDGSVKLWECNSGTCIHSFTIGAEVNSILVVTDDSSQSVSQSGELEFELAGKWLVVGDNKGSISIWDLCSKTLMSRMQVTESPAVTLSQSERDISAVFQNGTVCHLKRDFSYSTFQIPGVSFVSCACFYDSTFAVAFGDSIVRLKLNEQEITVTEHLVGIEQGSRVTAMAFHDGLYVACNYGNVYKFET